MGCKSCTALYLNKVFYVFRCKDQSGVFIIAERPGICGRLQSARPENPKDERKGVRGRGLLRGCCVFACGRARCGMKHLWLVAWVRVPKGVHLVCEVRIEHVFSSTLVGSHLLKAVP